MLEVAREQPGPVLGPTPVVWLLLGRVRVCGCLCGVSIVAGLDPACLCLFSFPLSPSTINIIIRERFEALLVLVFLRLIAAAEALKALFLQLLKLAWGRSCSEERA